MINTQQQKQTANNLRKQGRLDEALPLYKELYKSSNKDKFDAAGYIHCLRKLNQYEEAIKIAQEGEEQYSDFSWFRNEIIWTYIGQLKIRGTTDSFNTILPLAKKILELNPDDLQRNTTVLSVLKKAKELKKWGLACDWVDIINPDSLDKSPIVLGKRTTNWSNYLIWHHHKIRCLIHQNKYSQAIQLVNNIIDEASHVSKYFKVLEAHAYELMGEPNNSIQILNGLCRQKNVDWWVVHQLANVLNNSKGEKEKALENMYKAASLCFKIESIVTLLQDISLLCKDLGRMEECYYHILLCKLVRDKKEWVVKEEVEQLLKEASTVLHYDYRHLKFKEVLQKCHTYWVNSNQKISKNKEEIEKTNKLKKALKGTIFQLKQDKPFCFIKAESESYFCYKSEIKEEVANGTEVLFDVVPSFDKKKQQKSFKAVNIIVL
ncbi:tetratricopeptide repeat protein [Niallia taxi]|uniref:tetratricopeptide repeat protein n=1 Tax=Niallia taxi TaxID=2499688 RepID=UPI002E20144B|nr:tetratricopeptide repeat protein [Niallia taxi]